MSWLREKTILNSTAPNTKVTIGVVEFKIEATALSIWVSAKANKKAGIKVPKKAEIVIHFHCCFLIFFKKENPTISKKIAANKVLRAPSCRGVNPIKAFFINIKELPQTTDNKLRYNHFLSSVFITKAKVVLNIEF